MSKKEKIAIVGASGYLGEELIGLLLKHPGADITCITSRQHHGKTLEEVFPTFAKCPEAKKIQFTSSDGSNIANSEARFAFLALPHGLATEFALPLFEAGVRVIDLSADFRIKDPLVYKEFYGTEHLATELLQESVYGLPERYREKISGAKLIACPGCYPTSILLPLLPLVQAGAINPQSIVATSLSGVSGAGRKLDTGYLYVECNDNARQYGVPKHRHLAEIEQELSVAANQRVMVNFTPILAPLSRGILTTIYAMPQPGITEVDIARLYQPYLEQEPFIRILDQDHLPAIHHVARTNFIDIAFRLDPRTGRLVLMSAEDNLTKGAAGQAIQNFNLMSGQPETTGLL